MGSEGLNIISLGGLACKVSSGNRFTVQGGCVEGSGENTFICVKEKMKQEGCERLSSTEKLTGFDR